MAAKYLVLMVSLTGCIPMGMPPLDVEGSAGIATNSRDEKPLFLRSLRVGTNLLQGFDRTKNRHFDLGAGFIVSESITGLYERQGWYGHLSYFPLIGIEPFFDMRDPMKAFLQIPAMHSFRRIRLGLHATSSILALERFDDIGLTVAMTGELVSDNRQRRTISCGVANAGYSGDTSVGLKISGGVREFDGDRYWLATLGLTLKIPAIGIVIGPPAIFCPDDDEGSDDEL